MGLLQSLTTSANTLRVIERSLTTVQNNVANASTPGYVKQRLLPVAQPFDVAGGLPGGIAAGELQSSRDRYAEASVRRQQHLWGHDAQVASDLARLEPLFDVTGTAGIPGALNALFQSFANWSVAPNDRIGRQLVLDTAGETASRIVESAVALKDARADLKSQVLGAVEAINQRADAVRAINAEIRRESRSAGEPALDARLHAALEDLAEYVDITVIQQSDGSYSVMAAGQTPLVIGDALFELKAEFPDDAVIRDSSGRDVTSQFLSGRLGGLLETVNTTLPDLLTGLDDLAAGLADSVNGVLNAGLDLNGDAGADLFTYDAGAGAASTIQATLTDPDLLAAAVVGFPGGNGNALDLAKLADTPAVNGFTLTGFCSAVAAGLGRELRASRENEVVQSELLLQAHSLRNASSAVSLDEEAMRLLEYQRSYEAIAQTVRVLDELTETTIGMMR